MNFDQKENNFSWNVDELLEASQGELLSEFSYKNFEKVSTDTRTIEKNEIFVALKGKVFDGHISIPKALAKGVKGFIIEKKNINLIDIDLCIKKGAGIIGVDNTVRALGRLAKFRKKKSGAKLIAITGSNGKTSTREITASILKTEYKTLSSNGNFNNEIGLPLTLLRLNSSYDWAVVELGMNASGEIEYLSGIAEPEIGVIINAGRAHLEGLGNILNVAEAKCEMIQNIADGGYIIINGEDKNLVSTAKKKVKGYSLFSYGYGKGFETRVSNIVEDVKGAEFDVTIKGNTIRTRINSPGRFMILNALAAASAGYLAGISLENIGKGIENFKPVKGRISIKQNKNGLTIIDDTYNANPDSMSEAIKLLSDIKGEEKGFAVLGDMLELGPDSEKYHYEVGNFCAEKNIDYVCAHGDFADSLTKGAVAGGINPDRIYAGSKDEILDFLLKKISNKDFILVKGSRGMKMEKIAERLLGVNIELQNL